MRSSSGCVLREALMTELVSKGVSRGEMLAIYRHDFRSYLRKAFYVLHGPEALDDNWHLDAIAWALRNVGPNDVLRQMILMPPRSMKSLIVSVFWVSWLLGRDPRLKVMVVSHSIDLAKDLHKTFRDLISYPEIQEIFPGLKSSLSTDNDEEVRTKQGGKRLALSTHGNVTGRGADLIIIDDPLDAKHATNELERSRVSDWISGTLWTRMNEPARTPVVLVMQRLHMDDPVARLRMLGKWETLTLPAVFKSDAAIQLDKDEFQKVKAGELLHASRYTHAVLSERSQAMGKAAYSAQYLQSPIPEGGGMIDVSQFSRFRGVPPASDANILSVDSATGGDSGSYTAMIEASVYQGKLYVTGVERKRIDIPTQVERIISVQEKSDIDHIVVEAAHAGIAVIQELRKHYQFRSQFAHRPNFIEGIKPKQSKEVRMESMLKYVRTGKVLLPESAPWLEAFEHELSAFPNGKHDDQVDALSQLIKFYEFFMSDPCLRINRGLEPIPMR